MSDSTSIASTLRAQFPDGIPTRVNGRAELITGEEYERRLGEMTASIIEREDRDDDARSREVFSRLVRERDAELTRDLVTLRSGRIPPDDLQEMLTRNTTVLKMLIAALAREGSL